MRSFYFYNKDIPISYKFETRHDVSTGKDKKDITEISYHCADDDDSIKTITIKLSPRWESAEDYTGWEFTQRYKELEKWQARELGIKKEMSMEERIEYVLGEYEDAQTLDEQAEENRLKVLNEQRRNRGVPKLNEHEIARKIEHLRDDASATKFEPIKIRFIREDVPELNEHEVAREIEYYRADALENELRLLKAGLLREEEFRIDRVDNDLKQYQEAYDLDDDAEAEKLWELTTEIIEHKIRAFREENELSELGKNEMAYAVEKFRETQKLDDSDNQEIARRMEDWKAVQGYEELFELQAWNDKNEKRKRRKIENDLQHYADAQADDDLREAELDKLYESGELDEHEIEKIKEADLLTELNDLMRYFRIITSGEWQALIVESDDYVTEYHPRDILMRAKMDESNRKKRENRRLGYAKKANLTFVNLDEPFDDSSDDVPEIIDTKAPDPLNEVVNSELKEQLLIAIDQHLTSKQKSPMRYKLDGKSLAEIAELLGESPQAISNLINRSLKKLSKVLKRDDYQEFFNNKK